MIYYVYLQVNVKQPNCDEEFKPKMECLYLQ
jgi:hypothetical protein